MDIGFFDSGIGGLHVLHSVIAKLPEYHYVFLGDTVNVPYGEKSDEEIYELTKKCLQTLFEHNCELVIFACNTASVTALRCLQDEFLPQFFPGKKLFGVIIPTVEEIFAGESKTVGIIATERTIHSGKYEREIEKLGGGITVISVATPRLVPLVENGDVQKAGTEAIKIIRENILPHSPDIPDGFTPQPGLIIPMGSDPRRSATAQPAKREWRVGRYAKV